MSLTKKSLCVLMASLLLISLIIIFPLNADAKEISSFATGDNAGITGSCNWKYNDGTLTISGKGYIDSYNSSKGLYAPWKEYRSSITSVVIEDGVSSIGKEAFYDCNNLTTVTMPNTITNINDGAFKNCSNLNEINLPDNLEYLGTAAFKWCSKLDSVVIPNSIKEINDEAFIYCNNLSNIVLPNTEIYFLGKEVFYQTEFYNNENNWDNGVLYLGTHLINTNKDIPEEYTIKAGTIDIANSAFASNEKIKKLIIPNGVTNLGYRTFNGCKNLENVIIPNSVKELKSDATPGYGVMYYIGIFENCSKLNNIIIPESITFIGGRTFCECTSLTTVTFNCKMNSIPNGLFYNCSSLEYIELPEGIKRIEYDAFNGCSHLKNVKLNDSLQSIGKRAFYNCFNLSGIEIPENVSNINEYGIGYYENSSSNTSVLVNDFTIAGKQLTLAEEYANKNGIKFVPVDESGHIWDDGTITKEPSCKENGEKTYTCIYCKETKTESIPALGHDFGENEEYCLHGCGSVNPDYVKPDPETINITTFNVSTLTNYTYDGKAKTQNIYVSSGALLLIKDTDYSISYTNNKNAGTATMTITGIGKYTGTITKSFVIEKAKQPMFVKSNKKSAKVAKLKKSKVKIKGSVTVKNNQGAVSYSKISKGSSKSLSITKKGIITITKGKYKKGATLTIKVKVTAKGNKNYKTGSKTISIKIKIK